MDKKRCTNFTKDEIQFLVDLVEKYKDVVECKRTDCTSNAAKEKQWRKIEIEFSSMCGTGRTAKMLRSKWDSMKKSVKKEYAEIRQSLYKTGGGPPDEKILGGVSNKILVIIGVGATGTESKFDSDFVEKSNSTQSEPSYMALCDEDEMPTDILALSQESPSCSWNSWNPQQLRTPTSRTLLLSPPLTTPSSATMDILTADCEPIAGPSNMSSDTKKEAVNCETTKKISNESSVKRKRFYKREPISAKIQKYQTESIYEEVAKKKIEFINFQMALLKEEADNKERRLAEKHQIKIKILEAELKNKSILQ